MMSSVLLLDDDLDDEFDQELAIADDKRYVRSYASRRASFEPDYDYSRDDFPYGPSYD